VEEFVHGVAAKKLVVLSGWDYKGLDLASNQPVKKT
jgi:hypothetical protein